MTGNMNRGLGYELRKDIEEFCKSGYMKQGPKKSWPFSQFWIRLISH